MRNLPIVALVSLLFVGGGCVATKPVAQTVTSFEACVAAGNAVMESYPRQCRADGKTFVEDVGNAVEKMELIQATAPVPNAAVSSPVVVTGQARGTWYFEASFPVQLVDANGTVLGTGIAQAQDDWMTEEFVPFTARVTYVAETSGSGMLVLQKDNPSGLPPYDDALEIPVSYAASN